LKVRPLTIERKNDLMESKVILLSQLIVKRKIRDEAEALIGVQTQHIAS